MAGSCRPGVSLTSGGWCVAASTMDGLQVLVPDASGRSRALQACQGVGSWAPALAAELPPPLRHTQRCEWSDGAEWTHLGMMRVHPATSRCLLALRSSRQIPTATCKLDQTINQQRAPLAIPHPSTPASGNPGILSSFSIIVCRPHNRHFAFCSFSRFSSPRSRPGTRIPQARLRQQHLSRQHRSHDGAREL